MPREVKWIGNSRRRVKGFPDDVRGTIGGALWDAQNGQKSPTAKPFKGVAAGVFEIVADSRDSTYRAVYAVKIGDRIYVLHAFQKKSKKGIKTPQKEVDLINSRYQIAVETERRLSRK